MLMNWHIFDGAQRDALVLNISLEIVGSLLAGSEPFKHVPY